MHYDKRQNGSHGRSLTRDIPELNLRAGDRLEPSSALADVGGFEDLDVPATVVFWRCSLETIARHRNPLFCAELGTSPRRSLIVDLLHCMNLGVLHTWVVKALWLLLTSGVFGDIGTADEKLQTAVMALRHELLEWYKERHIAHPKENLTRLADLTVKMIGTQNEQKCKTKGAETYGLSLFVMAYLDRYRAVLGERGQTVHRAGWCLYRMQRIWAECGCEIPHARVQECFDLYSEHISLMRDVGDFIPKHHLMWHMLENLGFQGNPLHYACWLDEALNKVLKAACRDTSQATFEGSVLMRMRYLLADRRGMKPCRN